MSAPTYVWLSALDAWMRGRVAALWRARAEILTAFAFVAGWLLVTSGVAALTSPIAWRFSLGLLAISLGGWRVLWTLIRDGLYALTKAESDG